MPPNDRLPWMPFGVAAICTVLVVATAGAAYTATSTGLHPTRTAAMAVGFTAEIAHAMDTMMADMAISPSGDVDRDFVAMMVPHHQGAIDMALAQLRHGKDETLRRMAQEIIVEQQQEIAAMRLALDRLPKAGTGPLLPSQICTSRPIAWDRPASPSIPGGL